MICDFCSGAPVTACYHAKSFVAHSFSTEQLTQESVGNWAACDICAALIDAGLWDDLVTRVMASYPVGMADDCYLRVELNVLYAQLRENGFIKETTNADQTKA